MGKDSLVVGAVSGLVGAVFRLALGWAEGLREALVTPARLRKPGCRDDRSRVAPRLAGRMPAAGAARHRHVGDHIEPSRIWH